MSVALNSEEKKALLKIIQIIWGRAYSDSLSNSTVYFNNLTVLVVEKGLNEVIKCNDSMRGLVISLAGGVSLKPVGWLRDMMLDLVKGLNGDENRFNGLGCRNVSLAKFRSSLESTFQ